MNWPNRTRGFSGVSFLFGATDVFLYLFFLLGRQSLTILTHEVCCLDGMGQTHRIKVHRILDGLSPKKWGKFKASTSTMDLKLAILPTLQLRGAGMAISLQSFDLICQETWEGGMLNGSFLRMIFGTVAMASWWVSVMYGYVLWLGQCKVRIRTLGRLASNMFCSFWWHCGYLTLWATREDEEHWCKMIMKIHFRNGTGLAPPLCECCINNFRRVQLSAPRFSVWSSAKNGWIYHGEGCFLGVSNRDRHRNFSQDCRIAWYTPWVFDKIGGTTGATFFWLQHEYGNIKFVRFIAIWF